MKYLIVIEQIKTGFSAYSPDLPGCIATGNTRDEVEREMKGAIALHVDGLKAEGMAIPQPSSTSSTSTFQRSNKRFVAAGGLVAPSFDVAQDGPEPVEGP